PATAQGRQRLRLNAGGAETARPGETQRAGGGDVSTRFDVHARRGRDHVPGGPGGAGRDTLPPRALDRRSRHAAPDPPGAECQERGGEAGEDRGLDSLEQPEARSRLTDGKV